MPVSLKIRLVGDPGKKHGSYLASMLHGALMEQIESRYVEKLHKSEIHPFSQYVTIQKDQIVWTVNCLTKEAEDIILSALEAKTFTSIYLSHRDETLFIQEKERKECSFPELINDYYFGEKRNLLNIRFVSPTAFKSGGEYCIFPSIRLIFQSLMLKYDACCEENHVFSEEILAHYEKYARIIRYRLRSVSFHMEGVHIPAFTGDVTIKINGPQPMVNMAWMLAEFGTFSGIGIKTGLGMGGMEIMDGTDKKNGGR
ncbi:MAG: CRISPR system precrRNA processing endoribonuclease RAMP protein Cas6 [Anaerobutyricum sp.]|nr:CRISPR system precrRNA processing endoribonuclease RAMP protein Cas6 [Anaerobutyricum sp.]